MSLRARLTLAGGGAVFVALAIVSLVVYFSVRSKLHDQIDLSLVQSAQNVAAKTAAAGAKLPKKLPAGTYAKAGNPTFPAGPYLGSDASGYFQVIPSVGVVIRQAAKSAQGTLSGKEPPGKAILRVNGFVPLTTQDIPVAEGLAPPSFRDATYLGATMRLYTMRLASSGDGLVRTARPLTEANATITRVRWLLIGLTLGGAIVAALLGRLAAGAVLRPVRSLAGAVQDVTVTRDLNRRIPVTGRDEVASLAENFNAMLAALDESQRAQQQLIADASHELRTPLTAHRTNVELLARSDLPPERRPQVLSAAVRGIEELSALISDLIQAARNGKSVDARAPVALQELVAAAVKRAKRRSPGLRFEARLEPCTITGAPTRLERAVDNVLDNAVKWSPDGATIEVALADGLLTVRDHGPGIEGADLPHVFDRFYRAASARGLPGSGLGLAIVKQTVEDHGGSVSAANAAGGGAVISLRFDADVTSY
jgi:two-component system, OmpR family, sensor histidine kinase MprB